MDARQGMPLEPADSKVDAVAGSRIAGGAGGFPSTYGYKELGDLAAALGSPRLDHSELAGQTGFSYRISSSQPAEILTN